MKTSIAQVVFGLPVEGPFDYAIPDHLKGVVRGSRVRVSFGRRMITGYVIGIKEKTECSQLKDIGVLLDQEPFFNQAALTLAEWMAAYYGCSLGEALETMIPFAVRLRKRLVVPSIELSSELRKSQTYLYLDDDPHQCWNDLIKVCKDNHQKNKKVLFLTPDAVTADFAFERLNKVFADDVCRLDPSSSKKMVNAWMSARQGQAIVIVGVRSAVFSSVGDLGAIILMAEHHYGYTEDQTPFYDARTVALKRAEIEGFDVIFVSSAPTVELEQKVESGEVVSKEVIGDMAAVRCVDLANYRSQKASRLAFPVTSAVGQVLDRGGKVLVLYNRRGFSTISKCPSCDFVHQCQRCDVPLMFVHKKKAVVCPSCDQEYKAAMACPECGKKLEHFGEGVEHVVSDLARYFPQAKVALCDRETRVGFHNADILVATQAVISLLDVKVCDCAVFLDADASFSRFDFRAHHKVFSLVMDLRKIAKEAVFVQVKHSENEVFRSLAQRRAHFYEKEIALRKELHLPPFKHVMAVCLRGKKEEAVIEMADEIYEHLQKSLTGDNELFESQADIPVKLRDQYRYIIMIKTHSPVESFPWIKQGLAQIKKKRGVIVTYKVDP